MHYKRLSHWQRLRNEEDPDYDETSVTIVTKTPLQKVLGMCNRFRSFVTSIRREDERKRAQGRDDRNDYGRGTANEMEALVDLPNPIGRKNSGLPGRLDFNSGYLLGYIFPVCESTWQTAKGFSHLA